MPEFLKFHDKNKGLNFSKQFWKDIRVLKVCHKIIGF